MITRQKTDANLLIAARPEFQVIAKVVKMQRGFVDKWHKHPWHQVIFPFDGILQTKVGNLQYVVPHSGMLFIPAHTYHESFVIAETKFIGVYFNPKANIGYPLSTKAVTSTPLIRELIIHIAKIYSANELKNQDSNSIKAVDVLIELINGSDTYDISLLLPSDKRLMIIFNEFLQNLQLDKTLSDWAKQVGASERTLSRLFTKDLGMSFPLWRQHVRLISSLSLLESKLSIQQIAYSIGYNSDSSYIFAFKKLFKQTPKQYRSDGYKLVSRINSD